MAPVAEAAIAASAAAWELASVFASLFAPLSFPLDADVAALEAAVAAVAVAALAMPPAERRFTDAAALLEAFGLELCTAARGVPMLFAASAACAPV
jgi:hypothetical protein